MAVVFMIGSMLAFSSLCRVTLGTQFAECGPSLSNECADFILEDPRGPQMMLLAMELAKNDPPNVPKAPLMCNGRLYDLSLEKWQLANQAMQKGLPKQVLANMLDKSGHAKNNAPDPRLRPQTPSQRVVSQKEAFLTPILPANQPVPCSIVCDHNGDMSLRIGHLQVPMEQMSELANFVDISALSQMASALRSAGVPVVHYGNHMTMVPSFVPSPENDIVMRIHALNGEPVQVELSAGGKSFCLPGQEESLNRLLDSSSDMAFPIMKLLARHGIPAEFDCNRRTLTTALSSKSRPMTLKATPITPSLTLPLRHVTTSPQVQPSPNKPERVKIGKSTFDLPMQWPSILEAVQSNQIVAAKVQKVSEERGLAMPDKIQNIIFTKIMQMRNQLMPVIRGGDCIFVMNGNPFSMLTQPEKLSNALRDADVPRELVRDAMMRVGLPAKNTQNGLQITLPSQQTCLLDNMANYKIFEYKIMRERDSVTIMAGPKSYRLPEDAHELKRAMDSGKVLPLELMDSLNRNGISCNVNMASGIITMSLPGQGLSLPLPMTGKMSLKLHPLEGPLGTSYMLEYDGGRLHLPSQIDKLNQLIAQGTINSYDVLHLFLQNTLVPYQFDKARMVHVIEVAGQKLNVLPSSLD
ncbi:uncharacterized protein LOC111247184 isoform X1 [Varroa destructor]|uniref:Uncharacterized protein n=1 Tax=Varroa destructor TaxID=109461 RepID=A0A7M7MD98_VARDE|nr:uncharacterized protein LOC111247184 isoform X1 [Varroa destructor]